MFAVAESDFPDELRADFRQFYNLDIDDIDASEAALLTAQLPRGSRTVSGMEPRLSWTHEEYLLAHIVDLLQVILFVLKRGKGRKPEPLKRPQARKHAKRRATHDEIAARLNGIK